MIFITGWILDYRCFNCNHIAMVEMGHAGIQSIKVILALGEEFRRCPKCQLDKFRMIHASIARSSRPFGEPSGEWKCPEHTDRFYPIALERAFDIISGVLEGTVMEVYKEIARLGYPLRCPKCQTLLQYHRGDAYHNYGSY
jgi:uncharacterized C2H2 Zn-finger protein